MEATRPGIEPRTFLCFVLKIYVGLAIFQSYLDLEARDNPSLKW